MLKATKSEIAQLIKKQIYKEYSNPNHIYEKFTASLNKKIRSVSHNKLSDIECKSNAIKILTELSKGIQAIPATLIAQKISNDIIQSAMVEIDAETLDYYVKQSARDRVRDYIEIEYKFAKKKSPQRKIQKKRK